MRDEAVGSRLPRDRHLIARGELVPQDPNDEPATELLKRIAEKIEKMQAAKKETPRKGAVAGSDLVADGVTGEGSVAPKSDKR